MAATSTPKSRHREFFEKLYGSLETPKTALKLDSSSSSDEGSEKKDSSSEKIQNSPSFDHHQSRFLAPPTTMAPGNFPYFPHHFGVSAAAAAGSAATSAASVEAALRLPDFPFPGGLAAFCKYILGNFEDFFERFKTRFEFKPGKS